MKKKLTAFILMGVLLIVFLAGCSNSGTTEYTETKNDSVDVVADVAEDDSADVAVDVTEADGTDVTNEAADNGKALEGVVLVLGTSGT